MCLGAQARAANEQARRNYQYQIDKREKDWMQTLSLTKAEHVQYKQGIEASNLGLAETYADIEEKFGDLVGEAFQANESEWIEFLQNNKSLAASGQTGRSAERIATLDLAEHLRSGSRKVYQLTKAGKELSGTAAKAAGAARAQQMQMFAQNAFVKHPDLAPPQPVMQNVGAAAFMDALKIASSVATIGSADFGTESLWNKITN